MLEQQGLSRRDFLRTVALASTAIAISSCRPAEPINNRPVISDEQTAEKILTIVLNGAVAGFALAFLAINSFRNTFRR